jgi:hypothetical protein
MKGVYTFLIAFLLLQASASPQQIITEQSNEPIFFKVRSHDTNFKNIPEKSFYKSKSDWQYIIDTTWGPGLPLAQKQQIFNAYVLKLEEEFDGFESLGFTPASWDSLKTYYYLKIDSTTSRGRFSAIMYYFALNLCDGHTYAFDLGVTLTPLNPGIPVLVLGGFFQNEHFGATVTVLEDSTALVLRVVDNHPLNLEPGDIILGYEGILWKDLVQELLEAELPAFGAVYIPSLYYGGTTGSPSSYGNSLHISVGMNWHLFDTIDVLKYSTGEIVHLSVAPLLNLNLPPMFNNEQLEIPNIPFPNYWNEVVVTYGILPNSNIGYVYILAEYPTTQAEQQFYAAISALKNTDGLIIDMRFNAGGWALWHDTFGIISNEVTFTIDDAYRCSSTNWFLCPANDTVFYRINGNPPDIYDRPIALLLGPSCISMGDLNAYRLKYLPMVKTFGKPTAASLGFNLNITNFPDWCIKYSLGDMYHLRQPGNYLNRKEFPIDYPVWFNTDDVANGYDTVVEEALSWINNLVYGHNVTTDEDYYSLGNDTAMVSATVENPNSNDVTAKIYIENLENTFIDSIELTPLESSEIWIGDWITPNIEDIYKLTIRATDNTIGESFTISNVNRITTAGPVELDSITWSYDSSFKQYSIGPYIRNKGNEYTIDNPLVNLISDDSWVTYIYPPRTYPSIPPGGSAGAGFIVRVDTTFPGYFNFKVNVGVDGWYYWEDADTVVTDVEDEIRIPLSYKLYQNFSNPFNPTTTIQYQIPELSFVTLNVFNLLGEEIKTLVNNEKTAGSYQIKFNATNLPSGIYFYRLQAGDYVETKKMVLLK